MIRLVLRFDDPSSSSDRALEEGILAAAAGSGIPLTVAVIPYRPQAGALLSLTAERASHLIQAHRRGIIEVAQHGYAHESAHAGQQPPSEFRGVDVEGQIEKIRDGRSVLQGLFGDAITGFVPPWNTFDARTTRALAQIGFRYLSAGEELDPDCMSSVSYLPRTCQMAALPATLDAIGAFASLDPVIIAVMHHYDFIESGNAQATTNLTRFGALLDGLRGDPRLQVSTLSGLVDAPCASLASRLRQNAWKALHWRIQRRLPSQAMFQQTWRRLIIYTLLHAR